MSTKADLDWTATDARIVDLIRVLAMDSVQKAGSGHPGTVEAGISAPWRLFTGDAGASIGVDHFGASADYKKLYQEFGITAERVAAAARDSLARVRD